MTATPEHQQQHACPGCGQPVTVEPPEPGYRTRWYRPVTPPLSRYLCQVCGGELYWRMAPSLRREMGIDDDR